MKSITELPQKMRALSISSYGGPEALEVVEKDLPLPGRGEVLIKMTAAPVQPADLSFLQGSYGIRKELPVVPGMEGGGVVVAAGGGLMARRLLGKRVAVFADGQDGTWAEYMKARATSVIPLKKSVPDEYGAMFLVNPITAVELIAKARKGKHQALVQTAAAGALGDMIRTLAGQQGIAVINIVRRAEQAEELQARGAEHVLVYGDADFAENLQSLARRLEADLVLDAVMGDQLSAIMSAMPAGTRAICYGALSGAGSPVSPAQVIFNDQSVEGFWLSSHMKTLSLPRILSIASQVQKLLSGDINIDVRSRPGLKEAVPAIREYVARMSGGKVLIRPAG